jgi:hypothetical protein
VPVQLNAVSTEQTPVLFNAADWHELEQSLAVDRMISQVAPIAVVEGQLHVHCAA